ncbi:MAG: hypothetical protein PHI11_13695 [Gallionella sp.]|nr:hypothetical protein [Gallionella sp.]
MSINVSASRPHPKWGWATLVVGLYPMAIACNLVPYDSANVHAPMWVVFLCGFVFVLNGMMILLGHHPKVNELLAAILLTSMGSIAAWIALFAPSVGFSGGIPFLPDVLNISLARWGFGGGALVLYGFAAYAIRRLLKMPKEAG